VNAPIPFDNSYARLGDPYSAGQMPEAVRKPALIRVNEALAAELLGIDATWLASDAGVERPGRQRPARGRRPPSPPPTPGTSSASSTRSSGTVAPCSSARKSAATAGSA
jgi:hypothetical protein